MWFRVQGLGLTVPNLALRRVCRYILCTAMWVVVKIMVPFGVEGLGLGLNISVRGHTVVGAQIIGTINLTTYYVAWRNWC